VVHPEDLQYTDPVISTAVQVITPLGKSSKTSLIGFTHFKSQSNWFTHFKS